MIQNSSPRLHNASRILAVSIILLAGTTFAQLPTRTLRDVSSGPSSPPKTVSHTSSPSLFLPVVTYFAGYMPTAIAIADVNGDGIPDLVLADTYESLSGSGNGGVSVLLGIGDGTFRAATTYSSGGNDPRSIAIADFNGDDKPDVVVSNFYGAVAVLLGNGDGTLKAPLRYSLGTSGPFGITVADLNSDGRPDVVVANFDSNSVAVLLGKGDGTFEPALTYRSGGLHAVSVAVTDVSGDGKPDIVVANECATATCDKGSVSVLLGNGEGSFQPAKTYSSGGYDGAFAAPESLAVADVNEDGKPDLTVGNACATSDSCPNATVSVLLGDGEGSFRSPVSYPSGGYTVAVTVADINGDRKTDLIVADECGNGYPCADGASAGILLGNGDGTFQSVATYSSGGVLPYAVSAADLNGDGQVDVVIVDCNDWTVGVLINDTTSKIPTNTSLLSAINPSVYGQSVTFTATVTSSAGVPPNGESINFFNGTAELGTAPLSAGTAVLTTSALPAGVFTITAVYPGDSNFAASKSAGLRQTVNSTSKSATTTVLTSSLNPSTYGQKVTFTAVVTTANPVPPTGTVSFTRSDGFRTFTIGTATLNGAGVATLTKSNLDGGRFAIMAVYKGDTSKLSSTSTLLNQTVLQTTTKATITSSPNPSTVGEAVTFTAKITSPTVMPTGPVTFTMGRTTLGTAQLSSSKATFTTSSLPLGSNVVNVTYLGNSNIAKSSAAVTQVVQP